MELREQVVIKASTVADAVNKMRKLVKRGAVDGNVFNLHDMQRWYSAGLPLYVTVYSDGKAIIQNHDCQPAVVLKRVRDVENYRV